MSFNEEQLLAIEAKSTEDILISAGAGSGKTKTLSERVFTLVDSGEIKPSALLVLTFTNNSAHEMKERILARFGEGDPHYAEMLSAHIQSFDSFNAYLVRSYAGRLGVAPSFTILPDTFYQTLQSRYVDEALEEAYLDPAQKAKIVAFLSRFGYKNDGKLKSAVLLVLKELNKLPPDKRAAYLASYRDRFLSDDFVKTLYHDVIAAEKKAMEDCLRRAYVLDQISASIVGEDVDFHDADHALTSPHLYQGELRDLCLSPDLEAEDDFLNREFREILTLCDLDDEEFVSSAVSFLEDHAGDYFQREYPGSRKKELCSAHYHKPVFVCLKGVRDILKEVAELGSLAEEGEKLRYFSCGVDVLFSLADATERKLYTYRLAHNAYVFGDVSSLALSLFTDPAYADIAEEIRSRFDYVMVDEYQDTNDAQETFLDSLLTPRKDGSRAHLFCVGDAKQSIYAFRASNVALFRARQKRYLVEAGSHVIPMNKNYRSAKRLLDDINHIFSSYMTLDMGGTDYLDPMERLTYDQKVNLYNEDLPGYGVHRILPPDAYRLQKKDVRKERDGETDYEAKAILEDIKNKIASGFLVFDRAGKGKKVRPCRYGDFCVLIRKKKSVSVYQKLFNENGVPLNNHLTVDLREVNAIILLQSLLRLLCYVDGDDSIDVTHCFASVARSYVYSYDDTKLHHILSAGDVGGKEVIASIEGDPIMKELRAFHEEHQADALHTLFLALIERFHVIEKLYLIGDVEDNVAKIESLYALLLSMEQVGGGLGEFVSLFEDIDKHRLAMDSETVQESEDAVDLMTIHGSKGLERKIVYLPSSQNGISKGGGGLNRPGFEFNLDDGFDFPYLALPTEEGRQSVDTLVARKKRLCEVDEEEQEHVRLLYVALTRAENAVYVVGRDEGEKNGYVMYSSLPRKTVVSQEILSFASASSKKRYEDSLSLSLEEEPSLPPEMKAFYLDLRKQCVLALVEKEKKEAVAGVLDDAYQAYLQSFLSQKGDVDYLAKVYAKTFYPALTNNRLIGDFASLQAALSDYREEDEEGETAPFRQSEQELKDALSQFALGVENEDIALAFPHVSVAKDASKDTVHQIFIDALLPVFASLGVPVPFIAYDSYKAPSFADEVRIYDSSAFKGNTTVHVPTLPKLCVDEREIEFPKKIHARASKAYVEDEEIRDTLSLERGTRLHRYMELLDFGTRDLSFIPAPRERKVIEKAIGTSLMSLAFTAEKVYREYGYYDIENGTNGYIDLLFVKDGVYHVVDYKSSNIDDPEYERQLHVYAHNVARLFHVKEEDVRLHLLSLSKGVSKDVK